MLSYQLSIVRKMSTRKSATKKQMYELSSELVGRVDERVTHEMRKGVPDEYTKLLQTAREDTDKMVDERLERGAKIYVRKLYNILIDHEYTPLNARVIVLRDCRSIWTKDYVLQFLPEETKDPSKQKGGRERQRKNKQRLEQESKEKDKLVNQILPKGTEGEKKLAKDRIPTPILRGLAAADQATRDRVAKAGGDAKYEQHPEDYSEMGKNGMESRWKHSAQVTIEQEEHQQIVTAYKASVSSRSDGTGAYILFIKNGEYEKVEPVIGNTPQSVNK